LPPPQRDPNYDGLTRIQAQERVPEITPGDSKAISENEKPTC
jgi:hypothetical protein